MPTPKILSGKFHAGTDLRCGEGVVIDVAEEVVVGDRVTLAPGTHLSGRRVTIGDDFFGYDWSHQGKVLDVGRGRRDDEDAVLTVGSRCTFHDNRIDLARAVTVGDDVGLSPEVVIYTHGYWMSCLEGFPCRHEAVSIWDGTLVGFRSVLLAGTRIGPRCVVSAQSVCAGLYPGGAVYGGNPARRIKSVEEPAPAAKKRMLNAVMEEWAATARYRGLTVAVHWDHPVIAVSTERSVTRIDVASRTLTGYEDEVTDDLRWFLFTRGIRVYTKRPFRKLEKR